MANAISRRRRALESDIDEGNVIETGAPYELSRAAMRNRYGTRRIDASAPQSSRSMNPTLPGVSGGRTDDAAWRSFFPGTNLGSSKPVDATGMADFSSSSLFGSKPFIPLAQVTRDSLMEEVMSSNTKWLDEIGRSIDTPRGTARPGYSFTSKFGRGSVGVNLDTAKKLALLGMDEEF